MDFSFKEKKNVCFLYTVWGYKGLEIIDKILSFPWGFYIKHPLGFWPEKKKVKEKEEKERERVNEQKRKIPTIQNNRYLNAKS